MESLQYSLICSKHESSVRVDGDNFEGEEEGTWFSLVLARRGCYCCRFGDHVIEKSKQNKTHYYDPNQMIIGDW